MDATDRRRQWLRRSAILALACATFSPIAGLVIALPLRIFVYPNLPVNQLHDGRMWIFMTVPVLMAIGAAIGFGLGSLWSKRHLTAILELSIIPALVVLIQRDIWLGLIARHGRDVVEVHLFYAPVYLAGLSMAMAAIVGLGMIGRVVTDHLRSTEET